MLKSELRDRFLRLLDERGMKQSFISEKTGIPQQALSKFKQGDNDLGYCRKKLLDEFLTSFGY